jgi:hypothetical protein
LKANLEKISKRAWGFYENPQFLNSDLLEDFEVILNDSDKILTVSHRKYSIDIDLIFSEAMALFSLNRTISDLWKINYREFENFLRDENHLPAFAEDATILEEFFVKMKISLIASTINFRQKTKLALLKNGIFNWRNLSLVEKNIWSRDFLEVLGWTFIFCDEGTLTVANSPLFTTNESLELLLMKIFGVGELDFPLKVVAV